MNLNELSQKLEDHLTDQDIQDAQELLDSTYQEIVDMRGELVEAQAEIDALKQKNAELLVALESAEPHLLGYAGKAVREAIAKARGDL